MSEREGVCCYRYKGAYGNALIVVNGTVGNFAETELFIGDIPVKEAYVVDRETGEKKRAAFEKRGGRLKVFTPLAYLSSVTILLK